MKVHHERVHHRETCRPEAGAEVTTELNVEGDVSQGDDKEGHFRQREQHVQNHRMRWLEKAWPKT